MQYTGFGSALMSGLRERFVGSTQTKSLQAGLCVASLLLISLSSHGEELGVDFAHDIVPILKEHCFECHGGEEAEGGFSINTRRLFLEGDAAIPGNAMESLFLELILDPDPEYRMPSDGKPPVPEAQVALLKRWVEEGMDWEVGYTFGGPTYEPPLKPRNPDLPAIANGRDHPLDRLIDSYLSEGNHSRPKAIDDATFLRRVFLDLVGLLPTPEETRAFLADRSLGKRTKMIDDLLGRNIPYTEHWLTFWNDLLRNDYDGTGFITGGRKQISGWLYESLRQNKSFDAMVRELIAPTDDESSGFIDGIKWRGTVSAGQSLPIQFSQNVSQSLLGINMKCASCHDSFVDRWTLAEAYGLAAIYSEEPLELFRCDIPTGEMASPAWLYPELGQVDPAAPKQERLAQLAELFLHPENGRVPRTIVNRLWGQMMGRGIVYPLDAMGTEPWNADLLDWLASDFQRNGNDLKRTLRLIATSQAYQSIGDEKTGTNEKGDFVYKGPVPKRLTAEQFVDAIWQLSASAPVAYDAPIVRGAALPDNSDELSISSSWVWGSSVDTGLPPNGETVLLRREFNPSKPIRFASVIAAADNIMTLYLNNERIISGSGWMDLKAGSIASRLEQGGNRILIVAENTGPKPNAAGVFCAIRMEYEDGSEEVIVTDSSWQVSETVPEGIAPERWRLDELSWSAARELKDTSWEKKTDAQIGAVLAKTLVESERMLRASLFKADSLMRSLGRPNRDQIVTSRPNELTTLEAVDLSTSEDLMKYLRLGAEKLIEARGVDKDAIIEDVYLGLLTRFPNRTEKALLRKTLGRNPDADKLTDLLWALVMTPEFFIMR
ncbi:MAG: DUF1549 domain-containing protein [Opitutaceae bacterium]|nr:DUF1549 domain-containing protein [Opitutaceae bacterium]